MDCLKGPYTVPKVNKSIFRDITQNVAGKTRYYVEYLVKYLVFLSISCYISEILITFWRVHAAGIWRQGLANSLAGRDWLVFSPWATILGLYIVVYTQHPAMSSVFTVGWEEHTRLHVVYIVCVRWREKELGIGE